MRNLGLIPMLLIYTAVANGFRTAADGRRCGLLLCAAWELLAAIFVCFIDFDKGRKEAGNSGKGAAGATISTSVASTAA